MPRAEQIPECPEVPSQCSTELASRDYAIRLVTPLCGGGVEPGQADPSLPIRGASIRGQLRFWWRTTCGRLLPTNKMWRREEEIFGSRDFPSPLEVEVSGVQGIERLKASAAIDRDSPVRYALFPAIENETEVLKDGLTFHLTLRWPNGGALQLMRAAQNQRRESSASLPCLPRSATSRRTSKPPYGPGAGSAALGRGPGGELGRFTSNRCRPRGRQNRRCRPESSSAQASERGGRRPSKPGGSRSGSTASSDRPRAERCIRRQFPPAPGRNPSMFPAGPIGPSRTRFAGLPAVPSGRPPAVCTRLSQPTWIPTITRRPLPRPACCRRSRERHLDCRSNSTLWTVPSRITLARRTGIRRTCKSCPSSPQAGVARKRASGWRRP